MNKLKYKAESHSLMKWRHMMLIFYFFLQKSYFLQKYNTTQTRVKESLPTFRPRFAGKCDPQSRDLTHLPKGYNFAVKPATNHPCTSCWMHTWDNVAKNFSKCSPLGFEPDTFGVESNRFIYGSRYPSGMPGGCLVLNSY